MRNILGSATSHSGVQFCCQLPYSARADTVDSGDTMLLTDRDGAVAIIRVDNSLSGDLLEEQ